MRSPKDTLDSRVGSRTRGRNKLKRTLCNQNEEERISRIHVKMGKIKDRNGMDLTIVEDIKKK